MVQISPDAEDVARWVRDSKGIVIMTSSKFRKLTPTTFYLKERFSEAGDKEGAL